MIETTEKLKTGRTGRYLQDNVNMMNLHNLNYSMMIN